MGDYPIIRQLLSIAQTVARKKSDGSNTKDLTPPPPIADDKGAKQSDSGPRTFDAVEPGRITAGNHASQPDLSGLRPGSIASCPDPCESSRQVESSGHVQADDRHCRCHKDVGFNNSKVLADLLRSIARVLDPE
jgi:hypothetical protein